MMANHLAAAPVLSTPDNHILTEIEPAQPPEQVLTLSEEQLLIRYEVDRTIQEIRRHRWRRVALQFPDHMLPHSSRVYEALSRGLSHPTVRRAEVSVSLDESVETATEALELDNEPWPVKLTILADTSYGSCCVDEVAAEHIDAEAVIHYGRACLSPTARLPVVHIFTQRSLDHDSSVGAFIEAFPDRTTQAILTADIPYASHVKSIGQDLQDAGYGQVFAAEIIHDPSSIIPNRTLPPGLENGANLSEWHLFHIAEPPTSLLLNLSSKMKSVHIYDPTLAEPGSANKVSAHAANTAMALRRRYALVTSMTTVSTWGILINTLSVKNYLSVVDQVKRQIAAAGKKSYLFVVGKLNAAKVANFAEIEGWVVIGCWESSLIDSRDFYRPILTPFELSMALARDDSRVWTGAWRSDFDEILNNLRPQTTDTVPAEESDGSSEDLRDLDSEEESEPPEYDFRTGRYVARSRPMGAQTRLDKPSPSIASNDSQALTKRVNGALVSVNGVASPAAEYLREKRTWQGLGSDFEVRYEDQEEEGSQIEEGRTGVAGGYTTGDSSRT